MKLLAVALLLAACSDDGKAVSPAGDCPMATTEEAGDVAALKSQRCNVPQSMGTKHWYRLSATLPEQIVQLELWDNRGPFEGGSVKPGSYTIAGKDLDPATCGVCLRAMVDKGLPTQREYFASGGTVEVTAVSPDADAPFVASITNATFAEIDANKVLVPDGCTGDVMHAKIAGTMMIMGGTGGGGGGGGGGGTGGCPTTVGD